MKNILEYIICLALAVGFAHYLNGRGGFLIITVMVIGALLSVGLDLYVRKKIKIDLQGARLGYFGKGEKAVFELEVSKSTRLPTPFIEIVVGSSENLFVEEDDKRIRLTLVNRRHDRVSKSLETIGCGGGYVYVKEAYLCDYLGFVRLRLQVPAERFEVGVLPEIIDIVPDRELLRSAVDTNNDDEDEERETADTSFVFNGTPGYDHREYIPGDPLKRVNWKLSSKKDDLFVRLDEQIVSTSRVFALDLSPRGFGAVSRDRIIQGCFSICLSMMRSGYECELYFYSGERTHIKLTPSDDPQNLQTMLSRALPVPENEDRFAQEVFMDGRGATVFTDERDRAFYDSTASLSPGGMTCFITYGIPAAFVQNMWAVNDQLEFSKI